MTEEVIQRLQELYNKSNSSEMVQSIIRVHAKLFELVFSAMFKGGSLEDMTAGLLKMSTVYSFHERRINPNSANPIESVMIRDKIQLTGESDEDYQERIESAKFHASPTSIITTIARMKCNNLGKLSAVEHLATGDNWQRLTAAITAEIERYNVDAAVKLGEQDMLRFIYSFYYSTNRVPHTFPIYRSILVYVLYLRKYVEEIRNGSFSIDKLIYATTISDSSSGWGDRMYHAMMLRYVLLKLLPQFGYSEGDMEKLRNATCYIGFDVNPDVRDIYDTLRIAVSKVTGVPIEVAKYFIIDSLSREASKIFINNCGGVIESSSPTPLEIYSSADGDSLKYCPGKDPISDAQVWANNYFCAARDKLLIAITRRNNLSNDLPHPAFYEFIDPYMAPTKKGKVLVPMNVFVETILKKFPKKNYQLTKYPICYDDVGNQIRKCNGCKADGFCEICRNTFVLRTLYSLSA